MNHQPLISVVTVCYNAAATIEQTLLSVLGQTYPHVEYIIIDGGSTDGTVDIIKKYADRLAYWVSEPDKGIYDAMNKGIAVATGEWINFLNAGDWYVEQEVLDKVSAHLTDDADIVYGDLLKSYKSGKYVGKPIPIDHMEKIMVSPHPSSFIKTELIKQCPYNTKFRSSADYDFFYKAYKNGRKFKYMNVLVTDFDAEVGFSKSNFILARKENAILLGNWDKPLCKMSIYLQYVYYRLRQFIKIFFPQSVIDRHREKKLLKENILRLKDPSEYYSMKR